MCHRGEQISPEYLYAAALSMIQRTVRAGVSFVLFYLNELFAIVSSWPTNSFWFRPRLPFLSGTDRRTRCKWKPVGPLEPSRCPFDRANVWEVHAWTSALDCVSMPREATSRNRRTSPSTPKRFPACSFRPVRWRSAMELATTGDAIEPISRPKVNEGSTRKPSVWMRTFSVYLIEWKEKQLWSMKRNSAEFISFISQTIIFVQIHPSFSLSFSSHRRYCWIVKILEGALFDLPVFFSRFDLSVCLLLDDWGTQTQRNRHLEGVKFELYFEKTDFDSFLQRANQWKERRDEKKESKSLLKSTDQMHRH